MQISSDALIRNGVLLGDGCSGGGVGGGGGGSVTGNAGLGRGQNVPTTPKFVWLCRERKKQKLNAMNDCMQKFNLKTV